MKYFSNECILQICAALSNEKKIVLKIKHEKHKSIGFKGKLLFFKSLRHLISDVYVNLTKVRFVYVSG